MCENTLTSSVSYQRTINHVNTDSNDDDDYQLFETHKKNRSYSYLGYTLTTTTIPNLSKFTSPEKYYICFK